MRRFGIGPADHVLVPAYNCGSEVDAIASCGCDITFYRIDRHARIDTTDIIRRVTPRTRAVYVTHYFGWPQDLSVLAPWCREHGLRLLEDRALALFSDTPHQPLATTGDATIFSFRKTLGVPDGGALVTAHDVPSAPLDTRAPSPYTIARRTLALLKASSLRAADALGVYGLLHAVPGLTRIARTQADGDGLRPNMPDAYYFDPRTLHHRMSRLTLALLAQTDATAVAARRRANYARLADRIRDVPGAALLYDDLPPRVCPLSLPLVVEQRAAWTRGLTRRGIAAIGWWAGYHRAYAWDAFPDARFLKDHVVALPIHHELSEPQIDAIGEEVHQLSRRLSPASRPVALRRTTRRGKPRWLTRAPEQNRDIRGTAQPPPPTLSVEPDGTVGDAAREPGAESIRTPASV